MANKRLEEFFHKMTTDPALAEKAAALARENNIPLTAEDLLVRSDPLPEEDLKKIAGGMAPIKPLKKFF